MTMANDDEVLVRLDEQVDPAHAALVLVDIQNDFVHPDGVLGRGGVPGFSDTTSLVPAMIANSRKLLAAARATGVLTVFIQMYGDRKYQSAPTRALQARRSGGQVRGDGSAGSVMEGTWGADFYEDIRPDGVSREVVVNKYRYSAFAGTNLDLVRRSNGIKTMIMCGDATSGCVESTTRDGFFADYYVVTAGDACADFDVARHESSLRKMDMSFGYVTTSDELVSLWDAAVGGTAGAAAAAAAASSAAQTAGAR
jgi:ureidoacrylate peracid hydrolase